MKPAKPRFKVVFTEEEGTWSAHDPTVPGVYGLGPTRKAALADLAEATALLAEHDASQAADDAEDVLLADEASPRFALAVPRSRTTKCSNGAASQP
jgi:predicted RNase H-like HicB family nuclease